MENVNEFDSLTLQYYEDINPDIKSLNFGQFMQTFCFSNLQRNSKAPTRSERAFKKLLTVQVKLYSIQTSSIQLTFKFIKYKFEGHRIGSV